MNDADFSNWKKAQKKKKINCILRPSRSSPESLDLILMSLLKFLTAAIGFNGMVLISFSLLPFFFVFVFGEKPEFNSCCAIRGLKFGYKQAPCN